MMNGYGSHTYLWVNAAAEKVWVKYHFQSDQGVEGLSGEDATRIAGEDADFHRRDLYDAIAGGDFPSWTLSVQVMPYEDARDYRFNPFDLTKVWPLGRAFAYADTHRHRIGPNYLQLPVNRPRVKTNTYTFDGPMAYDHRGDAPVYAPNSEGRGFADNVGEVEESWESDGAMVRQAYTLRPDDDDFGQPGTLVREVWTDQQRADFVDTVAGHPARRRQG
jgi:catalase